MTEVCYEMSRIQNGRFSKWCFLKKIPTIHPYLSQTPCIVWEWTVAVCTICPGCAEETSDAFKAHLFRLHLLNIYSLLPSSLYCLSSVSPFWPISVSLLHSFLPFFGWVLASVTKMPLFPCVLWLGSTLAFHFHLLLLFLLPPTAFSPGTGFGAGRWRLFAFQWASVSRLVLHFSHPRKFLFCFLLVQRQYFLWFILLNSEEIIGGD